MKNGKGAQPQDGDKLLIFTEEQKALMRRTVAKDVPADDFEVLIYMAEKYGLDPFAKEIWAFKPGDDKPTVIMTSRDGYLTIAQRSSEYSGPPLSFVVCEGDEFSVDAAAYQVTHRFGASRGKILGAWAKIDRAGKTPAIGFVPFAEYNRTTKKQWNNNPSAMIQKVAEAFVLKRQFGIAGLVTREEMDADGEPATPPAVTGGAAAGSRTKLAAKAVSSAPTPAEPPAFVPEGEAKEATAAGNDVAAPARPSPVPEFAEASGQPAAAEARSDNAPAQEAASVAQPQAFVLKADPAIGRGRTGRGAKIPAIDASGKDIMLFAVGDGLLEKVKDMAAGQKILAVGRPEGKGFLITEVRPDAA